MKILFGCGIYAAFRGSSEHVLFSPSHVSFGIYPEDYEVPELRGVRFASIDAFGTDKSHKITVNQNYSRETSGVLCFPINENDPNCFGASLRRYINKLSPGQKRMYCYWRTDAAAVFPGGDGGSLQYIFHARKPLGMNKIRELFTEGAAILGLPKKFLPHSLRALCITRMVNDNGVSLSETMEVARHSSVAASKDYMVVNGVSAFNRMKALGASVPTRDPSSTPVGSLPTSTSCATAEANINPELSTVTPISSDGSQKNILELPADEKDDGSIQVGAYRNNFENSNVSMTQQGIVSLKEEIADFRSRIAQRTVSRPIPSKNQREIAELREIVKELKEDLEGHMHDRLYFESVTNELNRDIASLKEENEILRLRANSPTEFRSYQGSQGINDVMEAGEYTRARQRAMGLRLNEEQRRRDRERKMNARRRLF